LKATQYGSNGDIPSAKLFTQHLEAKFVFVFFLTGQPR